MNVPDCALCATAFFVGLRLGERIDRLGEDGGDRREPRRLADLVQLENAAAHIELGDALAEFEELIPLGPSFA